METYAGRAEQVLAHEQDRQAQLFSKSLEKSCMLREVLVILVFIFLTLQCRLKGRV